MHNEPDRIPKQWKCPRCGRTMEGDRGNARNCGFCPESRVQPSQAEQWTNDDGSLKTECPRIEECRSCHSPIIRTPSSKVIAGQAQCWECAKSITVKCGHPGHAGKRDVLQRDALRAVYVYKSKSEVKVERHDRIICLTCFHRYRATQFQEAVESGDMTALPFPGETFTLTASPRERYARDAVIFDTTKIDGVGEVQIVRFHSKSYQQAYWQRREVTWLDCERLRVMPDGTVTRDIDTMIPNPLVRRAILRTLDAHRRGMARHRELFPKRGWAINKVTLESLGWIVVRCTGTDEEGKLTYEISYPDVRRGETLEQWARGVLF